MPPDRYYHEDPPRLCYLDSSFVLAATAVGAPNHTICRDFSLRLAEAGSVVLYSALLFLEVWDIWRRARQRGYVPATPAIQLPLPFFRATDFVTLGHRVLEAYLRQYDRYEVRLNQQIRRRALRFMTEFGLRSFDAVHAASGEYAGCFDLATIDADFRRLPFLQLWNNGV